jgi:type II secretory pathway pseudopilin PulG
MIENSKKAFTIVELLTSIGIISILGGMGLPTLSTAREKAKRTICANNQRQIVMGMNMYAQDYDGVLPIDSNPVRYCLYNNKKKQHLGKLYPDYIKSLHTFYCPSQLGYTEDNETTGIEKYGAEFGGCLGSYVAGSFTRISQYKNEDVLKDVNVFGDTSDFPPEAHDGIGMNVSKINGEVEFKSGRFTAY